MRYYAVSTSHARILLTQLAQQDGLSEPEAARHVLAASNEARSDSFS